MNNTDYNKVKCEKCGWKGEHIELRWVDPYKSISDNAGYACPGCGDCNHIFMEYYCEN